MDFKYSFSAFSSRIDESTLELEESEMNKWYLVYTKPQQEKIAKLNLENQSLETYLPMLVTVNPTNMMVVSTKVMFPRYIFSRFNIAKQDYSVIRSTRGVTELIRFGEHLAEVSDDFIAKLKARSDYDEGFVEEMRIQDYTYGDAVLVTNGLLKGSRGIFIKKSKDRAKILLDIIQKRISVELFFEDLEKKLTSNDFKL